MGAPDYLAHMARPELLDYVNRLLQFDRDGSGADTAMGVMRWNRIGADELNARRASPNRPIYRPLGGA